MDKELTSANQKRPDLLRVQARPTQLHSLYRVTGEFPNPHVLADTAGILKEKGMLSI